MFLSTTIASSGWAILNQPRNGVWAQRRRFSSFSVQPGRRRDFPKSQFKAFDIFSRTPRAEVEKERHRRVCLLLKCLLCDGAHSLCARQVENRNKKKIRAHPTNKKAPAVAASLRYYWSLWQSPWQPRVWFSSSLIWRQLERRTDPSLYSEVVVLYTCQATNERDCTRRRCTTCLSLRCRARYRLTISNPLAHFIRADYIFCPRSACGRSLSAAHTYTPGMLILKYRTRPFCWPGWRYERDKYYRSGCRGEAQLDFALCGWWRT